MTGCMAGIGSICEDESVQKILREDVKILSCSSIRCGMDRGLRGESFFVSGTMPAFTKLHYNIAHYRALFGMRQIMYNRNVEIQNL
jgi:hypothetical protein